MNKRITIAVLVAAWVLLSLGCNNKPVFTPVSINYVQRMNFNQWDSAGQPGNPTTTSAGGVTVIYIKSIQNPADSGKTYVFKPAKLYIDNTSQFAWSMSWGPQVKDEPWRAGEVTVAPGQTANNVGCVALPTGGQAGNEEYIVKHNSSTDSDSVLMVPEKQAQVFNPGVASKKTLQERCQP